MTVKRQGNYEPNRLTAQDMEELQRQVQGELDRIGEVVNLLAEMKMLPQADLPPRYMEGTMAYLQAMASPEGMAGLHQVRAGQWRRLLEQEVSDSGWINATLINGWENRTDSWGPISYRRTASGFVTIKGLTGSRSDPPAGSSIVFVLPSGFRPQYRQIFFAAASGTNEGRRLDVEENGNVVLHGGATSWNSMAITFLANDA